MLEKTAQLLWGKLEATLQKYGASLDYDFWFGQGNSEFELFRAGMSSGMEDICKDKNSCVDIKILQALKFSTYRLSRVYFSQHKNAYLKHCTSALKGQFNEFQPKHWQI